MTELRHILVLVVSVGLASLTPAAGEAPSNSKRPSYVADLSFSFACDRANREIVEKHIESSLSAIGFKVLNRGRIQRAREVRLMWSDIVALDERRNIVGFLSVREGQKYLATLDSPAPTNRQHELEKYLLSIPTGIGCEVAQISRGSNHEERAEFHDEAIRRLQKQFEEAKEHAIGIEH